MLGARRWLTARARAAAASRGGSVAEGAEEEGARPQPSMARWAGGLPDAGVPWLPSSAMARTRLLTLGGLAFAACGLGGGAWQGSGERSQRHE